MANAMRYRLALDIGTNSLGWAMIRLNAENQPCAIIKAGVRIFSDGRNPKDGSSLATTRRNARAMRRRRDRKIKRKHRLLTALVHLAFLPDSKNEQAALLQLNPYQLRAEGLTRALTGPEFARALLHLCQRRGFLSNRKTDKKDNDASSLKSAIGLLRHDIIQTECQTLGQWLALRHQNGQNVRARLIGSTVKDRTYDFYADRAMIAHEFDFLWACQAQYQPALFNEAARLGLRDILLFQRPLKPVIPGRCTLLPDEKRAPLALPAQQRFRIYMELNNLRILDSDLQEQPLTLAQRDTLASLLERGTCSFSAMRKALKLGGVVQFNLEDQTRDRLKGNATTMVLGKPDCFGAAWFEFSPAMQDEIVLQLINEVSEQTLISWLQVHTGIPEAQAERVANIGLPEGYGSLSHKALDLVLPFLMANVVSYDKAVMAAGLGRLAHALQIGEIMPELPYYGIPLQRHTGFAADNPRNEEEQYGKIGNPTVHIALNQIRVVVNELIRHYGHPSQVTLEISRDLKLSRERKYEIEREQAANQKRNEILVQEAYKDACRILGLKPELLLPTKRRELAQKMRLWKELNPDDALDRRCPYSGEAISIERLFSNDVEIEHILPYSRTLDDSMGNKTIAVTRANRAKDNQTPWEAFGRKDQPGYNYAAILQRAANLPANKRQRFAPDGYQRWLKDHKDFIAQALTDKAYLSRLAREYLSCVCPEKNVLAIPARITTMLRGKLGLNAILPGATKQRIDEYRHHAIDAIMIGVTDRNLLQSLAAASINAREMELHRLYDKIPLPWPTFREHAARAVASIIVSHKPDHGYQGAMHEETAWGLLENGQVQRKVRPEGGGPKERQIKNLKAIPICEPAQIQRHGVDADGNPKAYKGYLGGSNYCLEIWRDDLGRWQSNIISTFEAYQIIRKHGDQAGWQRLRHPSLTQHGKPLVMRLAKKDYIRLELDGQMRTMVVAAIKSTGQIFMADHYEANVDARNRDKGSPFAYVSKMAGSLQKAKARRCTVSPAGRLRDPGWKPQ